MAKIVSRNTITRLCIGIVLAALLLSISPIGSFSQTDPAIASTALTESRIRQLEAQVRSLQTQVNQLQNQRSGPNTTIATSPAQNSPLPPPYELSPTQQFDNLATLVIEINRRVAAIESQLSQQVPSP